MKTLIKICGIRDPDTAKQTIELGANYIGIMCYKKSPRYVEPEMGKKIADAVKRMGGTSVAVFVDADAEQILSLCKIMGVNIVQLHGAPSRQTHEKLPDNFQRIYTLPVNSEGVIQEDTDKGLSKLDAHRDWIMYDALQGGSGKTFPLHHITHPYSLPFFLAGGLTPENVTEAIDTVHPNGVDVSSGVESSPGVKNLKKIKAFIDAVKGVRV